MAGHNVARLVQRHLDTLGDSPALVMPGADYTTARPTWDTWTFRELDAHSDAFAHGFKAIGVRPGDRTLVLLRPSLEFYAVLFGLFKVGAVPVLLDPGMGIKNLLACITRTKPRVMVALSAVHAVRTLFARGAFASVELAVTAGRRWFWGGHVLSACKLDQGPFPTADRDAQDDAAILFTSGSTGTAKGVSCRQAMFAAQVDSLQALFGFSPGHKDVQAFAAFAIFDLCFGMTSILPKMDYSKPAKARPEDIVAAISAHAPQVCFASPIVWENVSRFGLENNVKLSSVQALITVGAAIPAPLHRRLKQLLPEASQVWTPYGATEGMPLTKIGTDEVLGETWAKTAKGHGTCVGKPAPGATIAIIGITEDAIAQWHEDLVLPPGTLGEIVASGDQVSPEYKDADEANAKAKIKDGERVWHRMGDLGRFDAEGRLWFCGRKAHRVTFADGLVAGADAVEGIFNEHEDVFRTALIRVGQQAVLLVQMEAGHTFTDQTEAGLRAMAAGTEMADRIAVIASHPAFPTDARHNSKIRREDMVEFAASLLAAGQREAA